MSRLRWLFFWRRQHDDITREMDAHIAERVDELVDGGMSETDAHLQARREFGNVTMQTERSREIWIAPWLTSVWQDLRYAVRSLWRQPGFTVSAVGILAIGMGLVATPFTVINGVLRPWSVPTPSTLALVSPRQSPGQPRADTVSNPEYRYLREHSRSFTHLAAWMPGGVRGVGGALVAYDGTTLGAEPLYVSENYFTALGVTTQHGRTFLPGDEVDAASAAIAIISEHLWRELFDRSDAAVGSTLTVDDHPFTIVGIAQPGFHGVNTRVDVWMPLPAVGLGTFGASGKWPERLADPTFTPLHVVGRLSTDATHRSAEGELAAIGNGWRQSASLPPQGFWIRDTHPLSSPEESETSSGPLAVVGLVFLSLGLVMLLACANVGNLILTRGMARTRETAIRLSLGASRLRIARQFLTEALLLSALAAAVGLWIGWMAAVALLPYSGLRMVEGRMAPDLVAFGFAAGLAVLATAISGLAPALRLARTDLAQRAGDRHAGDPGTSRLRTTLLAVQIAVSMVLVTSAGLMTRGITYGLSYEPGFAIHDVQAMTFTIRDADADRRRVFFDTLDAALLESGVAHAMTEWRPLQGVHRNETLGRPEVDTGIKREMIVRSVSSSYFEALAIPLVSGRAPRRDSQATEVVISETAARMLWGTESPLGRRVSRTSEGAAREHVVVGVAADVPTVTLNRIDPVVYAPLENPTYVLIRDLSPAAVEQIGTLARGIEPAVRVAARPLSADLQESTQLLLFGSRFAWALGGLALLLATAGAYGVFAYMVEARRREIGVRMALGATPASVVRTVIGGVRRPLAWGLGTGLVIAVAGAHLFRSQLYGLSPLDPVTYLGVAAILTLAALVATWIPARRATQIDPAITLRGD